MKNLSDEEILNYIKTKEPQDKAGAYAIQGLASILLKNQWLLFQCSRFAFKLFI